METLPNELKCLIASYAMPIHPCKEGLENRLLWELRCKRPCFDCMSLRTKALVYSDADDALDYKDFYTFDDWYKCQAL